MMLCATVLTSCQKDRNCRCTTTDLDNNTTVIVNVDRNIKCKHLLELGIETLREGHLSRDVHPVTCEEVEPVDAYLEADTD